MLVVIGLRPVINIIVHLIHLIVVVFILEFHQQKLQILMHQPIYHKKFKQLSAKFIKTLQLEKIDQHQSLTFLHKNYKIHPSQIITMAALFIILIIFFLDGFNFIASVLCFLFPLVQCLSNLARGESKRSMSFLHSNSSEPGRKPTDQQFSEIISSNRKELSIVHIYIVYFISYFILEIFSFFFVWLLGSFSWLALRCVFAVLMLSRKTSGAWKLLGMLKKEEVLEREVMGRRGADLFQKW